MDDTFHSTPPIASLLLRLVMKRCLNENEIAQYAEYLVGQNNPPDNDISDHVAGCFDCKQVILEISELVAEGTIEL